MLEYLKGGAFPAGVAVAAAASAAVRAAVPEVSGVTMSRADNRLITIAYALAEAPAVVTLDAPTKAFVEYI